MVATQMAVSYKHQQTLFIEARFCLLNLNYKHHPTIPLPLYNNLLKVFNVKVNTNIYKAVLLR